MILTRRGLMAAGTACAAIAPAAAQSRWQAACAYPDNNFHTRNLKTFLEEVAQATGVQTQIHTNGSLLPMPQIKRGVQTGQVQVGEILISAYGNEDPFFEIDGIPQLATTSGQARKLRDLARPYVEARFARQGLTVLYEVPWPPSGFYTNAPVPTVEALRGTRMRTFSVMTNRFATLLGAAPTLVQAAEIAQAFAAGIINVMVTSAQTGVDTQAWDYARVFTPIGLSRTINTVFMQRRALEALPPVQQQAIRAAAARAEARGWAMSDEAAAALQAQLASRGMTVAEPSPELLAGLATVGNAIAEEWVGRAGPDGRKALDAYRAG
ncbi:TRAP transporter substrate-binding protein [Siccirubricoccus sp. KC 17139]|uniref:TRAP transporter substrate-binding protein n=1 Tax=Siccirubricoccus soli TaxID=2899147 RepID=A0ABT1D8L6_9PROT|nr:TRAP transporter substrate-binding protein [Siccirubricoccus soli]MCO6418280.1 TRAP transporter substrate-binding protein [Siccirubricoccus soli]MCP2684415.1 TRAP transporter substrate-binding protein [Siccirubricoccus soli]